MPAMQTFAQTFFSQYGATIRPNRDEWEVDLPPDLAEAFGKPRLYLVFSSGGIMRELSPHEDLLVYGSRTFDKMLALLAGRGDMSQLKLPQRHALNNASPLTGHNCRLTQTESAVSDHHFYLFNFRAVYRSIEKQEKLIPILVDDEGQPHAHLLPTLAQADTLPLPNPPVAINADHLHQVLEQATDNAHSQANSDAEMMETAQQPHLEKILLRLTTYYRRLTDEVDSDDAEQDEAARHALQQDLAAKIANELERYRVRVTLTPISYALVLIPFGQYHYTAESAHCRHTLEFTQNLYSGTLTGLTCHHCGEPLEDVALCANGHAVHAHCSRTCHRCKRAICHTCGIEVCGICGQTVCADCAAACSTCQRLLCAEHVQTCTICNTNFCTEHSFTCGLCGQTVCQNCSVGGTCQTCRTALSDSTLAETTRLVAANIEGLQLNRYQWRSAQNRAHLIYVGRPKGGLGMLRSKQIVVLDKSGAVVTAQKITPWRWWQRAS